MSGKNKTNNIKNLTDDVLCALAARDRTRKLGYKISDNPMQFVAFFHEYSDVKKNGTEKQIAKIERERKNKLLSYVADNLTDKDELGDVTQYIIID
jgi:hypothetical protein